MSKLVCNNCKNISEQGLMKGNGWIEIILWLAYVIPGVIYSIWRRTGEKTVCLYCKKDKLVPVKSDSHSGLRDCEWCAEPIKREAKICKHCKKEVEPLPIIEESISDFIDISDAADESAKKRLNRRLIIVLSVIFVVFFMSYSEKQFNQYAAKQEALTDKNIPFQSFRHEYRKVTKSINCQNPKIIKGSSFSGELYSCIGGASETVKFFINEKKGTNKVRNVKLMWNDWTKNLGEGMHADEELASKWVSVVAKLYAPDKSDELISTFFSSQEKVIKSGKYSIEYNYHKGPAIDERLFIITAK